MSVDQTPPIRTFERLVQYARPGKILVANFSSDGENVYPEWSEGVATPGSIIAFNGVSFEAMTVQEAASAAGTPLLDGSQDTTFDPGTTLTVEGTFTALPSGVVLVPYPTNADDAASKQYVDDSVQAILSASGGITQGFADARYINASGDTMLGQLVQPLAPVASGDLANKAYVDSISGGGDSFSTVTANTVLPDANATVFVDSTGGTVGVTLPSPHTPGRKITVKDFGSEGEGDTVTNPVRVYPGGSAKLEGLASGIVLTQNKESGTFVGDGTNWGRV